MHNLIVAKTKEKKSKYVKLKSFPLILLHQLSFFCIFKMAAAIKVGVKY